MIKHLYVKTLIVFLLLPVGVLGENCSTSGNTQYMPDGSCGTKTRACCSNGTWSEWGEDCKCEEYYGSAINASSYDSDTCNGDANNKYTCGSEAKSCIDVYSVSAEQSSSYISAINYSEAQRDTCDGDIFRQYTCQSSDSGKSCYDVSGRLGMVMPGTTAVSCNYDGSINLSSSYGYCTNGYWTPNLDGYQYLVLSSPLNFCRGQASSCWMPTGTSCGYSSWADIPTVTLNCPNIGSDDVFEYSYVTCSSRKFRSVTCCGKK